MQVKRLWCWEGLRAGGKGTTEDEMAGWHHWLDGREFEWAPGVGDGQGGLACGDSSGLEESDMTEQLNNITVLVPVTQRSDCIVLTVSFYIEKIFIYFGCAGSSLLHGLFSSCSEQGLLSGCSVWVSHCGGFSCCKAWALRHTGISSWNSQALEHKLNSYGAWA